MSKKDTKGKHERLAERLANIFNRLNNGECLNIQELAHDHGVCIKTIRRDLLRLESYLPLIRERGVVYLDNRCKSDLTQKEFYELTKLVGIEFLLPSMDIGFLRELIKQKSNGSIQIKGYEYENSTVLSEVIELIKQAVLDNKVIVFEYANTIRTVQPYKLINHRGCWYVIGTQNGSDDIKTYRMSKIINLSLTKSQFKINDTIKDKIDDNGGIWFGKELIKVVIQADNYASEFFRQKHILPNQKIVSSSNDGKLLIESHVYQKLQIFPMIRSWIPHLTIIEPKQWQDDLESELRAYLGFI